MSYTREIKFNVPEKVWILWKVEAAKLRLPLSTWVRLRMMGELMDSDGGEPVESATAPVQLPMQETVLLRERIVKAIGSQPLPKTGVAALARKLGVPPSALFRSLGSMVGSRRARRDGDVYHMMTGE